MDRADAAERGRLAALRRYVDADLPPEDELAGLVRVAATVAGAPVATLNLLDASVQVSLVTHGFPPGACERGDALCDVALREKRALHVPDLTLDGRFLGNPYVDGRLGQTRLYASSPLVTADGWMIGTLCVTDTLARTLAPAVLQALEDLAAQAMALLERRRLSRVAEEAVRAKAAFVASVSHELRTPLHGVLGVLDLLLDDDLPARARDHAGLARRSASSMLALVDDVLELSRGESGQLVLHADRFEPAALVRDVGATLGVLAQRRGLVLRTRVQDGVPAVLGDAGRVRQVLVNLVGNALKFTPAGTVEVALSAGPAGPAGVDLRLAVRDTGEGIAPDELATLFTPYAQGASGRRHGGTGLGLSISAGIVDAMGGRLSVDSVLGAGSTFTVDVRLPLAPEAAPPAAPPSCAGLRVLVADDSAVNRLVAVGLLGALGVQAEAVPDGAAAVRRAALGGLDAVLLDHEMPGLDGPGAARAIRGLDGAAGRVAVFALTGRVAPDDVAACLAAGMDGVLAKPLDVDLLAGTLAALPQPRPTG